MVLELEWIRAFPPTRNNLPEPGRWVAVYSPKDSDDTPAPFPAVLVETKHGYLWRDLTAPEGEVQYAPVNRNSLWAYVVSS